MKPDSTRVIADLKELAALTTDERGAQRVAWGPVWRKTREWFTAKLKNELGLTPTRDDANRNPAALRLPDGRMAAPSARRKPCGQQSVQPE